MEAAKSRMTMRQICRRWGWIPAGFMSGAWLLVGCGVQRRVEAPLVVKPELGPMTIAVAPALNLSGTTDFDPNRFADLMASELSYFEGISVVPVSRVLSALAVQGSEGVESPTHALELVGLLGADAILVFAVTEYDPYDPPSIGISAQLYGARPGPGFRTIDPVALSREACPTTAAPAASGSRQLLAQTQRVFDAAHAAVVADVREFAKDRSADDSAFGWRRYLVSQQDYIRFCCQATIRDLVLSRGRAPVLAAANREG